MTTSPAQAFADAAAAMVNQDDVTDTLANLLASCAELTSATALGLLVRTGSGELELLSATSHRTAELELYQVQQDTGPCVDVIHTGEPIEAVSPAEILDRWGAVGEAITAAGYESVYAAPLRWHGVTIGGLNSFRRSHAQVDREEGLLLQAFADVATIVVVQATDLTVRQVAGRIEAALEGRTVIEQAKGVLAYLNDVDMADAYQLLKAQAADHGVTLTVAAERIVQAAAQR
jgi:transcriptional regulator with GAF, ATPase, and Fis domain